MNWQLLFPSRFLKSAEFNGLEPTLTISAVVIEELPDDKTNGMKKRGVVSFQETPKQLVLNLMNAVCIKACFGEETNGWIGKKVTFFAAPFTDSQTGEQITAIRVRGSPDIQGPIEFQAKIGRRLISFRLVNTGQDAPRPRRTRKLKGDPTPFGSTGI